MRLYLQLSLSHRGLARHCQHADGKTGACKSDPAHLMLRELPTECMPSGVIKPDAGTMRARQWQRVLNPDNHAFD
jgi:hypothetical protein